MHPEGVAVAMPTDKCVTCGLVATPPKSKWRVRWEFCKRNIPAIISICSVILNVVIISRLIPDMQSSINVMQGQAQSVQSQVNTITSLIVGVNDKINDANNKIDTFNGLVCSVTQTLNATESNIAAFGAQAQSDIAVLRKTSASLLLSFENRTTILQQQLNASQVLADATLARAQSVVTILDLKAATSMQQLLATNTSAILRIEAVRDDFTSRIVPQVNADLQSLNMSSSISALESRVSSVRVYATAATSQTIPAGGYTSIHFGTTVVDTHGMHVPTDDTKFNVTVQGLYSITSEVCISGIHDSSISNQIFLMINGVNWAQTGGWGAVGMQLSAEVYLYRGDIIQIQSNPSQQSAGAAGDPGPWFMMHRISPEPWGYSWMELRSK